MKKLFILGLTATALLASCSNDEVLEILAPQGPQKIGFANPFLDKNTRAANVDLTTANLTDFFVFGAYTDKGTGNNPVNVFKNTKVSGTSGNDYTPSTDKYWVRSKDYRFIAYSNGNAQISSGLIFDDATGKLNINNYKAGSNDLILSNMATTEGGSSSTGKISFSFSHLLSKVKFTFTSACGDGTTIDITNLKFNAVGTGSYVTSNPTVWTAGVSKEYTYTDMTGITNNNTNDAQARYVIPQDPKNIKASFTITLKESGTEIASQTFKEVSLDNQGLWAMGNVYNYTLTVTPELLKANKIIFTVNTVTGWDTDSNVAISTGN